MGLVRASCTGSCWGSCGTDNSSTGSCSGCSGTCHGCSGGCSDGCTTSCSGCSGCGSGCANTCSGCGGSCSTNCSGCSGCSGCGGACSSGCTGCDGCSGCGSGCATGCTGSCSGCSGCGSGCAGTCSGDCNNACTSTSAAQTILNLGANIKRGNVILAKDLKELKTAAEAELIRRSRSGYISGYAIPINVGTFAYIEHVQKYLNDCNNIKTSKNYSATQGSIIATANVDDSIAYIKQLMQENIKS